MSQNGGMHFEISERKILLRILDVVVIIGALYLVGQFFRFDYFYIDANYYTWPLILGLYILFTGAIFELYDLQRASRTTAMLQNVTLATITTVLLYLLTPILTPPLPDARFQILLFGLTVWFSWMLWRQLYIKLFSAKRFNKRILLIADAIDVPNIIEEFAIADPNIQIVGYLNTDQNIPVGASKLDAPEFDVPQSLKAICDRKISEIVIATQNTEGITPDTYSGLIDGLEAGIMIREYAQVYEELTARIPVQFIGRDFYKFFPFARSNSNRLYLFLHRILDVLLAVLGLCIGLVLSPLVLIGNLFGNRGPLFYKQVRVGRGGKPFTIFKLRSMVINAEAAGAQWATKGDARITKFGSFLRRTRLDEVPQFINVLRGEMSIIGPRPERPEFVAELAEAIPFYETRHVVKPGVTGWAQVKTSYGSSYADSLRKLQYDLYYIKHRSIFLDMRIVVKTISTVIFLRGQ